MLIKILLGFTLLLTFADAKPMKMFQSAPAEKVILLQKGDAKMFCPVCGMHLGMFYKTSHAAEFKNGHIKQYCSIHCLVNDLEKHGHKNDVKAIRVVDVNSLKFIDARKAIYVVGSKIKGTMTMNSKYAFSNPADAKAFAEKNGGKVSTFDQAYAAAEKDFSGDTAMIMKKKKMMAKKGEKIYKGMCDGSKITKTDIPHIKAQIMKTKACGKLNGKQLQAVAIYLAGSKTEAMHISVPKNAKCPVCGMFVGKYPKWATQMTLGDKNYFFDGVKDMMKFYLYPQEYRLDKSKITSIYVTDYYTLDKIPAKDAYYVKGSNVYGPMGNEFIPFKNEKSAIVFKNDHDGKSILRFDQITKEMVTALDK